jgi:hypothetical protein
MAGKARRYLIFDISWLHGRIAMLGSMLGRILRFHLGGLPPEGQSSRLQLVLGRLTTTS